MRIRTRRISFFHPSRPRIRTGVPAPARDFETGIRSGKLLNNAEESALSTLTAILGRLAAYDERVVTWDEMIEENQRLEPNLSL